MWLKPIFAAIALAIPLKICPNHTRKSSFLTPKTKFKQTLGLKYTLI